MIKRIRNREQGASLVEFALVLPLFLLLVFGIMESGWIFAQLTETRNAAREGARLAVVDYGSASQIAAETCNRAAFSGSGADVVVVTKGNVTDPVADTSASVSVTIVKSYASLTGFLDPVFNGVKLDSTVEMRVERPLSNLAPNTTYPTETCP